MEEPLAYEAAVEKLEQIVKRLEADSTALDESLLLFEEGVRLSRYCATKLDEVEQKVLLLSQTREGALALEPMERSE